MELLIKQPGLLTSSYEIYDKDRVVATLACKGIFRPYAIAETEAKTWKFEQKGWLRPKILVKDNGSDQIIATFYPSVFSRVHTLEFNEHEQYSFKSTSWWRSHYAWVDKNGRELIRYKTGGLLKMNGEIETLHEVLNNPNQSLLIVLGLYQIKLTQDKRSSMSE